VKSVFIAYDQANHENVMEVLDRTNVKGYTLFPQVMGRGTNTGEPHMGSHAWPTMNSAIITIVEDEVADLLLKRLKEVDTDNEMLGLRAFVWNVEQFI
jgi:nitrogen regulatory protein PII